MAFSVTYYSEVTECNNVLLKMYVIFQVKWFMLYIVLQPLKSLLVLNEILQWEVIALRNSR